MDAQERGALAVVADERMRYVAVSARACEVLGYTRAELLKLSILDVASEAAVAGLPFYLSFGVVAE